MKRHRMRCLYPTTLFYFRFFFGSALPGNNGWWGTFVLVTICFIFSVAIRVAAFPRIIGGASIILYPSHHHEDNYAPICFQMCLLATTQFHMILGPKNKKVDMISTFNEHTASAYVGTPFQFDQWKNATGLSSFLTRLALSFGIFFHSSGYHDHHHGPSVVAPTDWPTVPLQGAHHPASIAARGTTSYQLAISTTVHAQAQACAA